MKIIDFTSRKRLFNDMLAVRLICAVLVLLLFSAAPCYAALTEKVRVAVIDYPNYLQMQPDGTISGYAYEYMLDIAAYTGWQYEFIEMSFADAADALANGDIDLLAGSQYTPERAEKYDYSARDMGEGGSVLCVMPDDMRYCYNDYASYDGLRIAALTGSVRVSQTQERLAKYGVSADYVLFDTDGEAKAALECGDVDAVLMSTIRCESKYKILARLNSAPLYFCVNKYRPELKVQLDAAMEDIHLNSPYYEERLDEKYFGTIPVQLAFTQEELSYIAKSKPVSVAVANDLAPVEYYSADGGDYRGIVPDSLKLVEEYSGRSFQLVPREDTQEIKRRIESGELQAIASVANTKSISKLWKVILTDPYYDNSVSMVVNDGVSDYKDGDCTVVLRTGYPYLEQLAREEGYTDLLYADAFEECVSLVNSREADITLIPSDCAGSVIHSHDFDNVSSYLIPNTFMSFCMGVAEGEDPLLLSILNKSLSSITKEQRTELLVKNLTAVNERLSLQSFFSSHRLSILAFALMIALIIICVVLFFAISRQRLNRRLKAALDKADSASRAKTEFLARMSHDMRTPMNGILGLSYLMEDSAQTPELKKELMQLRESGEYLLQLINDVLDVNKVESGHIELHPQVCDEEQLIESIISLVQPQMEEKGISFTFEKRNIQWKHMLLDEQRVKQVFINLLSNAIKFTPKGGRIDFIMELVSENEYVIRDRFIIRDTGIGISEAFLPKLFEPFAQENRDTGASEGTGLGLFIVKNLVELMGGSISVASKVNEGTEMTVYLDFPLAHRPEGAEMTAHDRGDTILEGLRVLLCEDHPLNAQIAARLLKRKGAIVEWTENGRLGVKAFSDSEPGYFDIILMDIRMPVLNGLDAAREIRALDRPDAETIPIIAMTANAYDEDMQKSLDAGMNAHLAKPVVPEDLYETMIRFTAKHGMGDQAK